MATVIRTHASRSPEYALLGFLYEQPNHGYDLHQLLVTELGQVWRVSQSQTYNILKRLEARGDISSTTLEQKKLPARQLLRLTPAGKRRFETWLSTPTGSSIRAIRLEFITRLYFAHKFAAGQIGSMIDAQSQDLEMTLTRLKASQIAIPPEQTFNRLGLELRIRQLESMRAWLDECRKEFE